MRLIRSLDWGQLSFICVATIALCALAAPRRAIAAAQTIKIETILVWGTDDDKSPNEKHKPVDAETSKSLKGLPLKWSHYFEETRRTISLTSGASRKEVLSRDCTIDIKYTGQSKAGQPNIEVCFLGKGQQVVKQSQDLPKGETLVVAGNAPNETAWLVVIKRTE